MYLNKTAERTGKIISVPHIIEMSCSITQRTQTGIHLQSCHWNLFAFSFQNVIELQCGQGAMKAEQNELHKDQKDIVGFAFNQKGGGLRKCEC